jgi:ketosteroid isomerase-like protein
MSATYLTARCARPVVLFCVSMSACWLPSPVFASSSQAARQEIAKDYASIDKAFGRRDADAALAYCTPDFVVVQLGETTKLAKERTEGRKQLGEARAARSITKIVKFSVTGNKAIVTIVQHMGIIGPVSGLLEMTDCTETERDLWVKSGGVWRIKKTTVLTQKALVAPPPQG